MVDQVKCPQCGSMLGGGVAGMPCPACLMKLGLDTWTQVRPNPASSGVRPTNAGTRFTAPSPETLAPLFPELEIRELLGQGGMGAVYVARQTSLDRLVALKIIKPDASEDPTFAKRFQREAQALAKLSHANIVSVYDFGIKQDGVYFLIMEYVEGLNLRALMSQGSVAPTEAMAIVPQICDALDYAHQQGVVHRDIKPENILLDKLGRVKIADFGLAMLSRADADAHSLTGTYQVMGTFQYMAPEQLERPTEVDHRADIYALGVVFYELLTGHLPLGRFDAPSHQVRVDVRLDEVVLRALEREPDRRYQHANDVKTDLDRVDNANANFQRTSFSQRPNQQQARRGGPDLSPDDVDRRLRAVGVLLMVASALSLLVTVSVGIVSFMFAMFSGPHSADEAMVWVVACVVATPMLVVGILGGWRIQQREQYGLAVAGSAFLIVPIYLTWPLSMPVGVWCLATLLNLSIRRQYYDRQPRPAALSNLWQSLTSNATGLGMIGVSAFALVGTAVSGISMMIAMETRHRGDDEMAIGLFMFHAISAAIIVPVLATGGLRMIGGRSRSLVVMAAIIGMLPFNSSCLLGIPVGIWCLLTVFTPKMAAKFKRLATLETGERDVAMLHRLQWIGGWLQVIGPSFWTIMATTCFVTARRDDDIFVGLIFLTLAAISLVQMVGTLVFTSRFHNERKTRWAIVASILLILPTSPATIAVASLGLISMGLATSRGVGLALTTPPAKAAA